MLSGYVFSDERDYLVLYVISLIVAECDFHKIRYICCMAWETWRLTAKPRDTPMEVDQKACAGDSHLLEDPRGLQKIAAKAIYQTVTRPDLSTVICILLEPVI